LESPEVDRTGVIPLPEPTETLLGGHAVLCVGYNDADRTFLIRNSWGTEWAQQGYGTLPYAYLLDSQLSNDFWQIKLV
jgi:C1A family cysteine protease